MKPTRKRLRYTTLLAASVALVSLAGVATSTAQPAGGGASTPVPGASSRMIYVSSAQGSDANDGLSPTSPKATLAAGAGLLRSGSSDWLLLRRGDSWSEGLAGLLPDGAGAASPIVVTAYGNGVDPRVMPEVAETARPLAENVVVYGIDFAEVALPTASSGLGAVDASGWTRLEPSADSRLIHVSSSAGSDSNSGAVEAPVRTIAKAYSLLRDGHPDWMLLRRGDVWQEPLALNWRRSGRSVTEPLVVGAYGDVTVPRPVIEVPPGGKALQTTGTDPRAFIAFVSLHLRPTDDVSEMRPTGVRWLGQGNDLLFEDVCIERFDNNMSFDSWQGTSRRNVTVRRCQILDSYSYSGHSQGLYATETDGLLIEECLFDHNGWREDIAADTRSTFNHNIYIQPSVRNLRVVNNVIARASATGLQARGGGHIEGNVFYGNPFGVNFGWWQTHYSVPDPAGSQGAVINNVIMDTPNVGFGQWALKIGAIGGDGSSVVTGNLIVAGDGSQSLGVDISGTNGSGVHGLDFAHNTIVNYHTTMRFWGDRDEQISEVDVHDNVFVQDDMPSAWRLIEMKDPTWQDPAPGLPRVAFSANRYFSRPLQANRWFRDFTGDMGFDGWASVRQEPSAAMLDASGLLPTPCVADYAASCGDGPSPAAFFDAARERRFGAWTDEYASATVLAYLQSWVVTAFANAGSE